MSPLTPADMAAADQAAAQLASLLNHLVAQIANHPDGTGPADPMGMAALAMAIHTRMSNHTCALMLALAVRKLATQPTTPERTI